MATSELGDALLDVGRLAKAYKLGGTELIAVAGVDLELRVGEVLGLVGESGSGKTSLARCIAGLVEPTEGSVRFDGQDVTVRAERRSREVRRRLQMVFQNPDNALNPRHTVRAILRRSLQLLAGVWAATARRRRCSSWRAPSGSSRATSTSGPPRSRAA